MDYIGLSEKVLKTASLAHFSLSYKGYPDSIVVNVNTGERKAAKISVSFEGVCLMRVECTARGKVNRTNLYAFCVALAKEVLAKNIMMLCKGKAAVEDFNDLGFEWKGQDEQGREMLFKLVKDC